MTDDEQVQLLARVTALEHLLEMGYANWMAQMTAAEFSEFQRQFESRLRATWAADVEANGISSSFGTDVVREAQGIAARFWKKVRDRERDIREARKHP